MNRSIFSYLQVAAKVATKGAPRDFYLGAVGIRSDGTLVFSCNLPSQLPTPAAHAEARLARKLDQNSTVYVARVLRNGDFAMSRPCVSCMSALKAKHVKRIFYTIAPNEWGRIDLA